MIQFLSKIIALVMVIVLRVPFQSQEAPDWPWYNDCGPAVAVMMAEYYTGVKYPPQDYYKLTGVCYGCLHSTLHIQEYLKSKDVDMSIEWEWTFDQLKEVVNIEKKPVIVAVQVPTGGHFMIVTGITDNFVYVNDPLQSYGNSRINIDTFKDMWYYTWSWQHDTVMVPDDALEIEFTEPYAILRIEELDGDYPNVLDTYDFLVE